VLTEDDFHPYQTRGIDWMTGRELGFVWLGMGDGKTVIAATAIAKMGIPAIVVGTKRIIEETWPKELKKWAHLESIHYAAATGPKKKREAAVAAKPEILGVNYESLAWLVRSGGTTGRGLLVYDEVSKMKSHDATRFKVMDAAMKSALQKPKAFGLTATPASEGVGGLWSQWRAIGGDDRLGRNITAFRNRFAQQKFRGAFTEYVYNDDAKEKIGELLSPDVFTIDSGERPYDQEVVFDLVRVPWGSKKAREQYRAMEKKLVAEVAGGGNILAASRGVASGKCRQLATGFIFDEDRVPHFTDPGKFDALVEELEALQGEPCLVFYQFIPEKDELLRRVPSLHTIEEGTHGQVLLHPRSAGHGLNLQDTRYVFFSSVPWSADEYTQAIGRVNRQGQLGQPVVKVFEREDSIDEEVLLSAQQKIRSEEAIIERMRGRQEGWT